MQNIIPTLIKRNSESELKIVWSDKTESIYNFQFLRYSCQCALCKHEVTGEKLIKIGDIPKDINLIDIKIVGNYGLNFIWSDNHSTGIYTYEYLKRLISQLLT